MASTNSCCYFQQIVFKFLQLVDEFTEWHDIMTISIFETFKQVAKIYVHFKLKSYEKRGIGNIKLKNINVLN